MKKKFKLIKTFKKDEIIDMVVFNNKLIIATKKGVYMYPEDDNSNDDDNHKLFLGCEEDTSGAEFIRKLWGET